MRACALSILLAGCVVQPTASTTPPPKPETDVESATGSVMDAIPYQQWSNVPGYVVGILYEAGGQEWGGSIGHMRNAHLGDARNEYKFSFDGASPYALYFESDGRGYNFLTGWSVPLPAGQQKYEQYDAAMFDSSTENDWGLRRKAHIVELEVNNGKGGAGLHFVVTDARVIDRTDEVSMDPVAVLVDMRRRFEDLVDARQAVLAAKTSESKRRAGAKIVGERRPDSGTRESGVAMWPTWNRDDKQLSVTFVYRAAGHVQWTIPAEHVKRPDCPPGAPCVDWGPPQPQDASARYGVEMGATFDVDAAGEIISVKVYEPTAL